LLFVSHDAGAIWTSIRSPKAFGDDPQVDVVDRRHIVVLTGNSNRPHHSLIASADAGATWRVVRPTLGFDQPGATLDFVTAAEGLLWVPAGETTEARPLYETVNGGRTWSRFTPSLHPTVCR
jgi:photosystem II stability/assembly factor-like uncharacterized protein